MSVAASITMIVVLDSPMILFCHFGGLNFLFKLSRKNKGTLVGIGLLSYLKVQGT